MGDTISESAPNTHQHSHQKWQSSQQMQLTLAQLSTTAITALPCLGIKGFELMQQVRMLWQMPTCHADIPVIGMDRSTTLLVILVGSDPCTGVSSYGRACSFSTPSLLCKAQTATQQGRSHQVGCGLPAKGCNKLTGHMHCTAVSKRTR